MTFEPPLFAFSALVGKLHPFRQGAEVTKIVVVKLDHIGDVVISTPILRGIRQRFPSAEIRFVGGSWAETVLKGLDVYDEFFCYHSPQFARGSVEPDPAGRASSAVRGGDPELVIGLRDDWPTIRASLMAPAMRLERGHVHLREWYDARFRKAPLRHEFQRMSAVVAPLNLEIESSDPLWHISTLERQEASHRLREHGIRKPFAVIHAGASHPFKEWDTSKFSDVARRLSADGLDLVLIGAPNETDRAAAVAAGAPEIPLHDLSGSMDLRATAALISEAAVYLGSDGGVAHIATAVGTPTVSLFGPGSWDVYHPLGTNSVGVTKQFPCSPCYMRECISPESTCMDAISVQEVLEVTHRIAGKADKRESDE